MHSDDIETSGKQLMDQLVLNPEVIINKQKNMWLFSVYDHYTLKLLFNKD